MSIARFLDAEHHLSYPFVLHHQDRAYLIPETHEIGRIQMHAIDPGGALGSRFPCSRALPSTRR